MGIYYGIANYSKKEYIYDVNDTSVKWYGIFHPCHPMARLLLYKLNSDWSEDSISLVNDMNDFPWDEEDHSWKDVTIESVYEYCEEFSNYLEDDPNYLDGFIRTKKIK